ncbi:aminoacyl-tRNA deacylase [Dietzia timorensis]|uniref:Cys-tRNA(Pro)/Cys-tRNA(Cys) deacylase n=1 Tax=Dietzia timorensis TaxID=499555 RepID=A0A173LJM1_9ACTN|nr:aminoacyl-tRNA deacylase [Dietzia timorensis]ANI91834.1 Cys-tRNA(Pro)/Cys-tRNA(Cys) deacylase YbaK [Dietzia timorensis]
MGKKSNAAATPALRVLSEAGVRHTTHTYESTGTDFGAEAAEVMSDRAEAPAERIFKTLVVALSGSGSPSALGVAMVPVDAHLDLKAVAATFGASKASMADKDEAQRVTGYVLGGVSPLGQKKALPTVIDEAAELARLSDESIFFSGGKRGLEIEMAPADFIALTGARIAGIATH